MLDPLGPQWSLHRPSSRAAAGSQSLRESRRAPTKKTCAYPLFRCLSRYSMRKRLESCSGHLKMHDALSFRYCDEESEVGVVSVVYVFLCCRHLCLCLWSLLRKTKLSHERTLTALLSSFFVSILSTSRLFVFVLAFRFRVVFVVAFVFALVSKSHSCS